MKKYFLLILLLLFMCVACEPQRLNSRSDLQNLIEGTSGQGSDLWKGTYYCGTKDNDHYILHKRDLQLDKVYIISKNELTVQTGFDLSKKQNMWVDISFIKLNDNIIVNKSENNK